MKITAGMGGRGAVTTMERTEHPNSHFEMHEMRIEKAKDGSFAIHHHMRLKKKHEGKDEFRGGYREPELHTAGDAKELAAHVLKHFGGAKVAKAASQDSEPDSGDENEASEAEE